MEFALQSLVHYVRHPCKRYSITQSRNLGVLSRAFYPKPEWFSTTVFNKSQGEKKVLRLRTKCHENGDGGTYDALTSVFLSLVLQRSLHRGMVKILQDFE